DYLKQGNTEGARICDEELMGLESDLQTKLLELQSLGVGSKENQFTAEKQDFLSRYDDRLHQPHWSGLTDTNGPPAKNLEMIAAANERAKALGIEEDSPAYFKAIETWAPDENPVIKTGDEALEIIRNSKYGRSMTARQYNNGISRLYDLKAKGQYSDR